MSSRTFTTRCRVFPCLLKPATQPACRASLRPRLHPSHLYSTKRPHPRDTLYNTRTLLPAAAIICASLFTYRAYEYYFPTESKPLQLDAPPTNNSYPIGAKVEVKDNNHSDDTDQVPTGVTKVPYFPKTIFLPRTGAVDEGKSAALPAGTGLGKTEEEYQLLGLGIRTVSFLRIQVYVVGIYVARADLPDLQKSLLRAYLPEGSTASTLVQNEKDDLRKKLLDGTASEEIWGRVLKEGGVRSVVRVVPVRETGFGHLRDGWVRGIEGRGKGVEYEGEAFKEAVGGFKGFFGGRGKVGQGRVLVLERGGTGELRALVEEGEGGLVELGRVGDERISRLVWLGYLAGKSVASEGARQSVIEGVVEVVGRPVGTVETQVL